MTRRTFMVASTALSMAALLPARPPDAEEFTQPSRRMPWTTDGKTWAIAGHTIVSEIS